MIRRDLLTGFAAAAALDPTASRARTVTDARAVAPFQVAVPQPRLDDILRRVRAFRWDAVADPDDGAQWRYGPPRAFLRDLCAYWADGYDWRTRERAMNVLPQFTAQVDGLRLHVVHVRGSGPSPRPMLIVPGWPYSFQSYAQVVERLTRPERFGGRAQDAVSVVIATLPGFGFSQRPQRPMGPRPLAAMVDALMVETLGYPRYLVHGGDWGAVVADVLGYERPGHVAGVHLAMVFVRAAGAPALTGQTGPGATAAERAFAAREAEVWSREGAYAQLEGTKPLKLAYAMADSPVGVAAWILEAYHAWSDRRTRPFETLFTRDQLLDEVMLHLVTDAFATSIWPDAAPEAEQLVTLPPGRRVEVPVAVAAFPDPVFLPVPREVVERSHNVVRYTAMPHGGHFPFYEAPELLADDLKAFASLLAEGGDLAANPP